MLNSKLFDKADALQAKLPNSINFFKFEYYMKISKKKKKKNLIHPLVLNTTGLYERLF